jgi:hypothetical protein
MRRRARRPIAILAALLLPLIAGPDTAWAQSRTEIAAKQKPKQSKAKLRAKLDAKAKKKGSKQKEKAASADARTWSTSREGGSPVLQYGKATEEAIISFSCQPDTGLMRVIAVAASGTRGPRAGDGARIRLMSGPTRFEVAGTAFAGEKGPALFISGTTRIAPRFFALFKSSETMTVEVPGRTTGISLKGLGPRGEQFERACLGRR